ncbi:hypothetical protein FIBSPDRAFT_969106 [Athelia psychrophila]|uniref:Uncharacterized protein n=1 Tax=Athelia psychrophila TaxID=1759441 RepID=A0A167TVD1_9AGAM|nr:hypothetical protein FIBSPDRAFT_969106 [Fibularhizoctonia sp. CBS 109695]
MTLAYALITVAMYIAWWKKPLNVVCAIRVSSLFEQPLPLGSEEKPSTISFIRRLFGRIFGLYVDPKFSIKLMKSLIMTWSWGVIDGIQDDYVRLHLLDGGERNLERWLVV